MPTRKDQDVPPASPRFMRDEKKPDIEGEKTLVERVRLMDNRPLPPKDSVRPIFADRPQSPPPQPVAEEKKEDDDPWGSLPSFLRRK